MRPGSLALSGSYCRNRTRVKSSHRTWKWWVWFNGGVALIESPAPYVRWQYIFDASAPPSTTTAFSVRLSKPIHVRENMQQLHRDGRFYSHPPQPQTSFLTADKSGTFYLDPKNTDARISPIMPTDHQHVSGRHVTIYVIYVTGILSFLNPSYYTLVVYKKDIYHTHTHTHTHTHAHTHTHNIILRHSTRQKFIT